ncbi:ATP-dependent RNA helicase DDX1-like isoform X2 [Acropora millepora]|uniref:ATP-dependent RNA helicase DDX1-like isoform X2 n=1 Tax=Acropora millepora TaxID=45264 RepID=UPI001CF5E233|nr:ATP-dependent RNA helicase DDX1-like isoform X2 [Acropora millepora]
MAGHFSEFGLLPEICKAVEDMDWLLPTDVQAEAIPLILGGGDVLMAAETGSGKTGAFSLPVIQIVHETVRDALSGNKTSRAGASVAASVVPTTFRMNPFDRDQELAIDEKGFLCQSRDHSKWQGCRSTLGVKHGMYYYEATVTDEGLCRVGWATDLATFDLGTDRQGFGFGGTGKKSFGRQFDTYGEPFGINDTIGCYLDLNNGSIKFSKNGKDFGRAFDNFQNLQGSTMFAAVVLKNAEMSFNFGDSNFKYPPKGGYIGLSKAPRNAVSASNIKRAVQSKPGKFNNKCLPSAIIMEPSRELAQQTHDQVSKFRKYLPSPQVKEVLLIGGENVKTQVQMLNEGVDIVTGTPGKLDDFISTNKINLSQVRFFVLDEADGLLAQGNQDLILRIFNRIPKMSPDGKRLQMIVCSATLHSFEVKKLADKIMHFPTWVDLKGQDSVPETVHHVVCRVDPRMDTSWQKVRSKIKTDGIHAKDNIRSGGQTPESLSEAVKILKVKYLVEAINEHKMDQAIIFCRTKLDCDNAEHYLICLGGGPKAMVNEYSCVCLHSDRSPQERRANLQAFKDGEVRFLICTDVAARGIDISGVPFVVNVTFPDDKQNYVHRIGRVGRAERMGLAISLVSDVKEKVWYHSCPSRGKSCSNTRLKEQGGCAIWYDERQYLADVEEHLGESISIVQPSMRVPANEFDGKVTYGEKRRGSGSLFDSHTAELAPSVRELAEMEFKAQTSFLSLQNRDWMKH